jgi:hypothetical protein
MPATFPSHAAAVLPLKVWRPGWFDGVALVVGSTAPDLSYALLPVVPGFPQTHPWFSLIWWTLPVTLVLAAVVRLVAPFVAVHLPGWLALRDYGVLGTYRHWWPVIVVSALVGGATHIFWDGFTHGGGWFVRLVPAMSGEAFAGRPWWKVAQYASTVVGGLIAVGVVVYIGHNRLVRAWHGPPPPAPRHPVAFWTVAGVVITAGAVMTLADPQNVNVQGVRLLATFALALSLGAVSALSTARRAARRTTPRRYGVPRGR